MAKLEISLLAGEEPKQFLRDLTVQIDRLEALTSKPLVAKVEEAEEAEVEEDDDEDFAAKPAKKKAAAKKSFDDDEDEDEDKEEAEETDTDEDEAEVEPEDDEDDEEDEAPKKKSKAKKLTNDDCNDAAKALCKALGGTAGREKVLSLMKKHFGTGTISEIKPADYEKFVDVMNAALKKAKG